MAIATNAEYLLATLRRFDMTQDDIDIILAENPDLLTSNLDVVGCKTAIYNSLSAVLPMANVSEGGYSKSWNIEALRLWYTSLCNELGKTNALAPKVRNRSHYW